MSIEIEYDGRVGNNIFQYVFARLLAVKNGLFLKTEFPHQEILRTTKHEEGDIFESPVMNIENGGLYNSRQVRISKDNLYQILNKPLDKARYLIVGNFEDSSLYNYNEELIKSFFHLDKIEKNTEDIVVNIRLGGDFSYLGLILRPKWYLNILEKETFKKLYIVGSRPDEQYLKFFKKYNPIIVETDPVNDFHFIRKFDKIICSNSTYCWWAAFLSEASRIYISNKFLSPFLTSCKNSILIKGKFCDGYEARTKYLLDKNSCPDCGFLKKDCMCAWKDK